VRESLPIYLAAIGPKNLELCGQIADGWLAIFFSPEQALEIMAPIVRGRESIGKTMAGFDVVPTVPVVPGASVEEAAEQVRAYAALYVGGMGSRDKNFYNQLMGRMGYEDAAIEIQDKYMAKDYAGAAAAVPLEFLDSTSLLGPPERIAERLHAYADAGVTTLTIGSYAGTIDQRIGVLRMMNELMARSGLGD
jgi:alkanesulfonate monooxygenase SsuD/methylene tetrahydromethanopterin reductase-like flavin-dependent oxidoreductase (luciferase family)